MRTKTSKFTIPRRNISKAIVLTTNARIHWLFLAAAVTATALASVLAKADAAFDQAKAQNTAAMLNNNGSDQSMKSATNNAMTALMNLSGGNVPAAVTKGYQAYGNYSNSERMDTHEDIAKWNAARMSSAGGGAAASVLANFGTARTTFRRLGTGFLYEGETNQIATEFEKQSGMKRETFFNKLVTASESKISPDDPNLVPKVVGRFKDFVKEIPNDKFRGNLEKAISVGEAMGGNMVVKAVAKYAFRWKELGETGDMIAKEMRGAGVGGAGAKLVAKNGADGAGANSAGANAGKGEIADRGIASSSAAASNISDSRAKLADENMDDSKGRMLQSLLGEANKLNEDTIFAIVTARYRKVTPTLASLKEGASGK